MTQPVHDPGHRRKTGPVGQSRPLNQDDLQAQLPGSGQLGLGPAAPGVFGNDDPAAMRLQQGQILIQSKGSAGHDNFAIGQGQRPRRVHQSQQIVVLGGRPEQAQMLPPDGQKDPGRRLRQGAGGFLDCLDTGPLITGHRPPCRAFQCSKRHRRQTARLDCILAHSGGKRVRCIDDMADHLGLQIGNKPGNSAKTADPLGQGLRQGLRRAPGIGKHGVHPSRGQSAGQQAGLGRAAQQKDAVHG